MDNVKVIQWGLGAMGGGMAKLMLEKKGLEIVAAIDQDPAKVGKDVGEVLEIGKKAGVKVSGNPDEVFGHIKADLTIIATGSFTKEVFPLIEKAVRAKTNVICIAEQLSFPAAQEPELAKKINQLAVENGVTVLGTGINPGFVLDLLIIALTGVCLDVTKIRAARINDLSPFGPTVMKTQGVGTTPEEFNKGIKDGSIVGHVGFEESLHMIAAALGWQLDEIKQTREPIISNVYRETKYVKVEKGNVAGCRHIAHGYMNGQPVIELEHPQQVLPNLEGVNTGDYIWIEGTPSLNMAIKPEIPGGLGTIAMAVNMIPKVIAAQPGLVSMKDLPVPSAVLGDFRKLGIVK